MLDRPTMLRSPRLLYVCRPMRIGKVDSLVLVKAQLKAAPLSPIIVPVPVPTQHYDKISLLISQSVPTIRTAVRKANASYALSSGTVLSLQSCPQDQI